MRSPVHIAAIALVVSFVCLLSSGTLWAQTATVTATTGQTCAGTRFGSDLNCTANDFTSSLTFTQPTLSAISNCQAGQTISINIVASVTSGSADRYDVGYFFGENAIDPQLNTTSSSCSIGLFPTTPLPFYPEDTDTCGDFKKSSSATLQVNGIQLLCQPAAGTTALALPYVLSFKQSHGGNNCAVNGVDEIMPGTKAKCVSSANTSLTGVGTITGVTVNGYITVTKQTTPDTEPGTFAFSGTATPAATVTPATQNLADGASQTFQVPLVAGGTRQLVIAETALGGWDPTASITCTAPGGGSSSGYVTIDNSARTITADLTETNFGAVCTITNTKKPTVAVQKITTADFGGPFSFAQTNLDTAIADISTSVAATAQPASPTFHQVTTTNSDVTITETVHSDYVISTASCTDSNSSRTGNTGSKGSLSGNVLTIPAADVDPGSNYTCVFTNLKKPSLLVRAITNGGLATSTYSGNNGYAGDSILTTTVGSALAGTSDLLDLPSVATTVTVVVPSGYVLAGFSCSGLGSGGSAGMAGLVLTLDALATAPGSNIVCTFTYDKTPLVRVQKTTTGNFGGPFSFTSSNLATTPSDISTTAIGTATPASPAGHEVTTTGSAVSLDEAFSLSWVTSGVVCNDSNSAITLNTNPVATSSSDAVTIPGAAVVVGADITCLFTNAAANPTLTILKTADTAGPVNVGTVITYSFKVSNTGNVPVYNIVIADSTNAQGTAPVAGNEAILTDATPTSDSSDATANGVWDTLGPGDEIVFTAPYTVVQGDIDFNQ